MKLGINNKSVWLSVLLVALAIGAYYYSRHGDKPEAVSSATTAHGRPGSNSNRPTQVQASAAKSGSIDIIINALGTVTAHNTATVRSRVDGQLVKLAFHEGQRVKEGDLLAQIDPRPFEVQLEQANGQLARDEALLSNARFDLERYRGLLAQDSIAKQQVDGQDALVRQYQGAAQADQAQVSSAKLQLVYSRVTAPVSGRLGLRQVDVGNIVHANDATGLVVITQIQPINVVFAIPSDALPAVNKRLHEGESLTVEVYDREARKRLAKGKLLTIDNQIDPTTGTVKLKAEFANSDQVLFPNQFVNVRFKVETRDGVILAPSAGVQHGSNGTFFYVVQDDQTVAVRPVTLGPAENDVVVVEQGVKAGELIVTDGTDKLRQGAKVELGKADGKGASHDHKGN